MVSAKLTAMIASMALLGAVTPAAFAQFDTSVSQSASESASNTATNSVLVGSQTIDQGICQAAIGQGGLANLNIATINFESDDCS
jgi:hypothetical protein